MLRRQIGDLRREGPAALRRKFRRAAGLAIDGLFLLTLALPVVVLARLLKPFVRLRFGPIASKRLGHLSAAPDYYLLRRTHGQMSDCRDLLYHQEPVCNEQLKRMWDRVLPTTRLARPLALMNRMLPGHEAHTVAINDDFWDAHGWYFQSPPPVSFTPEEERQGQQRLAEMGLTAGSFVCLQNRDSAYLRASFPDADYSYHDYRNSDLQSFLPALRELPRQGLRAVRTGVVVAEPLADDLAVDCTGRHHDDFMDVYLAANCAFFLGDNSGYCVLVHLFRRPCVIVNFIPLQDIPDWMPNFIILPKLIWSNPQGRYLTFHELANGPVGRFGRSADYEREGLRVVDNTAADICDAAAEMSDRLAGRRSDSDDDLALQRAFWNCFNETTRPKCRQARISAAFLRRYRALLEPLAE